MCKCMCKCICKPVLRFSQYVAIDTYVCITNKGVCVRSMHDNQDDDKMNTLAFVNFLLIKIFPTLIHQNFPPSKLCAIQ